MYKQLLKDIKALLAGSEETGTAEIFTTPYLYAVAKNQINGAACFMKMGINSDVDNTEEDLWDVGGTYTFPSSAMQMQVVSSNGADASNGTGIRKVWIGYLDENFVSHSEVVTLNGVSPVATAATNIYRVNTIRAYETGSGRKAAGNIDIRHLNSTPIYRRISTGYTLGRSLIYTAPKGTSLYLVVANIAASASATGHYVRFTLRSNYDHKRKVTVDHIQPFFEMAEQDGSHSFPFTIPLLLPETCDMKMSVISDGAAANALAYAVVRGWTETT